MMYKEILERNIPLLLNLYNLDPSSSTKGVGDRLYWGWKVRDFINGTLQGGIHALSIAYSLGIIKNKGFLLDVLDKAILAIPGFRNKNGSVEEAYPREQSFCVTALVAFDILSALNLMQNEISKEKTGQYLNIIYPLIQFIEKNDEEHAIISNHLATGVAAIALWNHLNPGKKQSERYKSLLDIIYRHQSEEGWYREYEGADPGYQTLCTYYLAIANRFLKNPELSKSLSSSLGFLSYFVHPDGSIGGLYGSRNTEVFYPGGFAVLGMENPLALSILSKLTSGIENGMHVLPEHIDIGNYIPLINSYANAAWEEKDSTASASNELPVYSIFKKNFEEAGIYIHSAEKYYAVINYKKGGTIKVFDKISGKLDLEDGGIVAKSKNGKWVSTQHFINQSLFSDLKIKGTFYYSMEDYPTPYRFWLLRLLSMTLFKSLKLGNSFKKMVVKRLMTGEKKAGGNYTREFIFSDAGISVKETVINSSGFRDFGHIGKFKTIHMASSGYYTSQIKDIPVNSQFVEFKLANEHKVDPKV